MSSTASVSDSGRSGSRSLGGVLVHGLALFTSFVGPLLVYLVSDHPFTRENARRALNWHATLAILWTIGFYTLFVIAIFAGDDVTVNGEPIGPVPIPSPLETVLTLVAIALALAMAVTVLATVVYAVVGTVTAAVGSVWSYPGAIDVVGRFR